MIKLKDIKSLIYAADDFMPILIWTGNCKISSNPEDFNSIKYDGLEVTKILIEEENNTGLARTCLIFLNDKGKEELSKEIGKLYNAPSLLDYTKITPY